MQKDQKEQFAKCIELMQKDVEESPARIPYIGKPVKKRKCWRPKRRGVRGAPACQFNPLHDSLMRDPFDVHVANSSEP